jgi:tRNA-dihydrouridine synthase B
MFNKRHLPVGGHFAFAVVLINMNNELSKLLNRPLKIGPKTIPNRLVLAPMTFLGHIAFRQVLDELGGCGLMFSEMCSAGRIPDEDRHASPYFRWRDEEVGHLSIQMVGNKPARMALAAQRIEAEGLWGVDINLGCSTTTICKHNLGAALLKDVPATLEIISRIRQAVKCPLTVKFRTGWSDDIQVPVALARCLEDLGVDALTFHPRVAPDRRSRPPRWEYIGRVKAAVSIPVFGNGNVFDGDDCLRMLQTTGCDGVSLGRIAIARAPMAYTPSVMPISGSISVFHGQNRRKSTSRAPGRHPVAVHQHHELHIQNQAGVALQTHEQVFDVVHVSRDVAVKRHEELAQEKENIDA